jgi:hypothetical protein
MQANERMPYNKINTHAIFPAMDEDTYLDDINGLLGSQLLVAVIGGLLQLLMLAYFAFATIFCGGTLLGV